MPGRDGTAQSLRTPQGSCSGKDRRDASDRLGEARRSPPDGTFRSSSENSRLPVVHPARTGSCSWSFHNVPTPQSSARSPRAALAPLPSALTCTSGAAPPSCDQQPLACHISPTCPHWPRQPAASFWEIRRLTEADGWHSQALIRGTSAGTRVVSQKVHAVYRQDARGIF